MAQAMASMAGLRGVSSQTIFDTNFSTRTSRVGLSRSGLIVRAQQSEPESSRRAVLGLVAAGLVSGSFVNGVFAEGIPIKVGPPPAPSGGLTGTLNSDQARDLDLPLKERFFLQPLTPIEAAKRTKESAQEIVNVKSAIDKKAWPYVQNDLRLRASYLRYDLKTITAAKPKEEKKDFTDLTDKLFKTITNLDYAAKKKDSSQAEKYYAETVSVLNDVIAKLG